MDVTKLSSKGQVVIPEGIRKQMDLRKGDCFAVRVKGRHTIVLERLIDAEDLKRRYGLEVRRGGK